MGKTKLNKNKNIYFKLWLQWLEELANYQKSNKSYIKKYPCRPCVLTDMFILMELQTITDFGLSK